jgi:DNA-binding beta-propeller fold protein YncE
MRFAQPSLCRTCDAPARPYTTPEGVVLYLMDEESGRLDTIEQQGFAEFAVADFDQGVDLVAVGRFDRTNIFLSSANKRWYICDNIEKPVVESGSFNGTPNGALGAADGKIAYVAFSETAEIAVVNLSSKRLNIRPLPKTAAVRLR